MEIHKLSTKHVNGLEQHITQLLKMMRTAKLSHLPMYADLQALEQELGEARRQRFDDSNSEYEGY